MTNSSGNDATESGLLLSQSRFDSIRRWAVYVREHPVEVWGPQHVALVDDQHRSASALERTAEQERRIQRIVESLTSPSSPPD